MDRRARSNWRRIFCRWWGHEYVGVTHFVYGTPGWACLRCFATIDPKGAGSDGE